MSRQVDLSSVSGEQSKWVCASPQSVFDISCEQSNVHGGLLFRTLLLGGSLRHRCLRKCQAATSRPVWCFVWARASCPQSVFGMCVFSVRPFERRAKPPKTSLARGCRHVAIKPARKHEACH